MIEIASHEGVVQYPYRDSVGVWTIGIGHTAHAGIPDPSRLPKGIPVPMSEVFELFAKDLAKYEKRVNAAFTVPLKQHEFDAAVSFDYNTGRIHNATWVKNVNQGNRTAAKLNIMQFKKPPEIVGRRKKERDLFFSGKYASGGFANVYPADRSGRVQWSDGKRLDLRNTFTVPSQKQSDAVSTTEPPKPIIPVSAAPPLPSATPQPPPAPAPHKASWLDVVVRFFAALFKGKRK